LGQVSGDSLFKRKIRKKTSPKRRLKVEAVESRRLFFSSVLQSCGVYLGVERSKCRPICRLHPVRKNIQTIPTIEEHVFKSWLNFPPEYMYSTVHGEIFISHSFQEISLQMFGIFIFSQFLGKCLVIKNKILIFPRTLGNFPINTGEFPRFKENPLHFPAYGDITRARHITLSNRSSLFSEP